RSILRLCYTGFERRLSHATLAQGGQSAYVLHVPHERVEKPNATRLVASSSEASIDSAEGLDAPPRREISCGRIGPMRERSHGCRISRELCASASRPATHPWRRQIRAKP